MDEVAPARNLLRLADRPRVRCVFAILARTNAKIARDRVLTIAAGITFFALLALFPAIASIVSLYGMFADPASVSHILDAVAPFLPDSAITVLDSELRRLVAQEPEKLNFTFISGMIIAVWSASGGARALMDGLDVACETAETRSFWGLAGSALLFTVVAIVAELALLEIAIALPIMASHSPYRREFVTAISILIWPASVVFCALVLGAVYRFGPDRGAAGRRWFTWGSAIGAVLWVLGTLLFAWYVRTFGGYDRVYGSLGAAVGFLTWIWLLLVVLLAGAELNCEIDRERS